MSHHGVSKQTEHQIIPYQPISLSYHQWNDNETAPDFSALTRVKPTKKFKWTVAVKNTYCHILIWDADPVKIPSRLSTKKPQFEAATFA